MYKRQVFKSLNDEQIAEIVKLMVADLRERLIAQNMSINLTDTACKLDVYKRQPSELKAVIELGVDYLQGYLIGKPAAQPPSVPADIQELIRTLAGTSC